MQVQEKGEAGMKYCALAAALLLMVGGMAFGADIDGTWTGTIQGRMVARDFQSATPSRRKGRRSQDQCRDAEPGWGRSQTDSDQRRQDRRKQHFFFGRPRYGGQEMKMDYKGVLSGDTLKISFDAMELPWNLRSRKPNSE